MRVKIIIKFLDKVKLHWVNKFKVKINKAIDRKRNGEKAKAKIVCVRYNVANWLLRLLQKLWLFFLCVCGYFRLSFNFVFIIQINIIVLPIPLLDACALLLLHVHWQTNVVLVFSCAIHSYIQIVYAVYSIIAMCKQRIRTYLSPLYSEIFVVFDLCHSLWLVKSYSCYSCAWTKYGNNFMVENICEWGSAHICIISTLILFAAAAACATFLFIRWSLEIR